MSHKSDKDKTEQRTNITKVFLNNSNTPTAVNKAVDYVVIDNAIVADPNQSNPGVIITGAGK
jgi:hypothetical protein